MFTLWSRRVRAVVACIGHAPVMRIVLVAESFFPAVDGTTTTVKAVADRIRQRDRVGSPVREHAGRLGIPTLTVQQTPVSALAADQWRSKVGNRSGRVLVTASWMQGRLRELGVEAGLWSPASTPRRASPPGAGPGPRHPAGGRRRRTTARLARCHALREAAASTRWLERSPRSPATGTVACSGTGLASLPASGTGAWPSTSW